MQTGHLLTHESNPENKASLPQVTFFSDIVVPFTMNPTSHFNVTVSLYLTALSESTLPNITCGIGQLISEKSTEDEKVNHS